MAQGIVLRALFPELCMASFLCFKHSLKILSPQKNFCHSLMRSSLSARPQTPLSILGTLYQPLITISITYHTVSTTYHYINHLSHCINHLSLYQSLTTLYQPLITISITYHTVSITYHSAYLLKFPPKSGPQEGLHLQYFLGVVNGPESQNISKPFDKYAMSSDPNNEPTSQQTAK